MIISIEVPVFRGAWLEKCIESVFNQTDDQWRLSVLWDEGDEQSREILEKLAQKEDARVDVFFGARKGIACARHFLTRHSRGEWILPLDDDDCLKPDCVSAFLACARVNPWSTAIRARRRFIDAHGREIEMKDWFPFLARRYFRGITVDVSRHSHPYMINRSVFRESLGWTGFPQYSHAGEDCRIFALAEELGEVTLLDKHLYDYRLHDHRTSRIIRSEGALDMWRQITDETVGRRGLPLQRANMTPPFSFHDSSPADRGTIKDIEVVLPFYETNEREIRTEHDRPSTELTGHSLIRQGSFVQRFRDPIRDCSRLSIGVSCNEKASGTIRVAFTSTDKSRQVVFERTLAEYSMSFEMLSLDSSDPSTEGDLADSVTISFQPGSSHTGDVVLMVYGRPGSPAGQQVLSRYFVRHAGYCRTRLERCVRSLHAAGIQDYQIHVIDERKSSSEQRNIGLSKCSSPYVCFVDDDAEIGSENLFERLFQGMHALGADFAGPRVITPDGCIYCADPFFDPVARDARITGMRELDRGQYNYTSIVPWLPTTLLLATRSACAVSNGFDVGYAGSQVEDVDFCLRARSRGYVCVYVGDAAVIHHNCLRNGVYAANIDYFSKRWSRYEDLFSPSPHCSYDI